MQKHDMLNASAGVKYHAMRMPIQMIFDVVPVLTAHTPSGKAVNSLKRCTTSV